MSTAGKYIGVYVRRYSTGGLVIIESVSLRTLLCKYISMVGDTYTQATLVFRVTKQRVITHGADEGLHISSRASHHGAS